MNLLLGCNPTDPIRTERLQGSGFRLSIGTILLSLLLVGIFFCKSVAAATYYVNNGNGNDAYDGKYTSVNNNYTPVRGPWKTIAKVNRTTFSPGDRILFKRGATWKIGVGGDAVLVIPSSGADANTRIVFGAYGNGVPPLFDVTISLKGRWQPVEDDVYRASWGQPGVLFYKDIPKPPISTLTFSSLGGIGQVLQAGAVLIQFSPYQNFWVTSVNTTYETISGVSLFHRRNNTTQQYEEVWDNIIRVSQINPSTGIEEVVGQLPPPVDTVPDTIGLTEPGHWYWNTRDKHIYLYSDVDPNTVQTSVPSQSFAIFTNKQDYVTIQDIDVKSSNSSGVMINDSENVKITRIKVSGTGIYGFRSGITLLRSNHCTLSNNTIERAMVTGISIYADTYADVIGAGGVLEYKGTSSSNRLIKNTITDSGSSGIGLGTDGGMDSNGDRIAARVSNNVIHGNTISGSNLHKYDSAGIYTLFSGNGNVVQWNTVNNGGSETLRSAGIMADNGTGPLVIKNNTIEGNTNGGIVLTGTGSSTGHRVLSNSLINNCGPAFDRIAEITFFPVDSDVSDSQILRNYVQAAGTGRIFAVKNVDGFTSTEGHYINYNTYIGGIPGAGFSWGGGWNGPWHDFASWRGEPPVRDRESTYRVTP